MLLRLHVEDWGNYIRSAQCSKFILSMYSTLLALYRNGSSLSQERKTLVLKKLQFTGVVKLLAKSIQFMFEQSLHYRHIAYSVRDRKNACLKVIHLYFCTNQTRYKSDFGDGDRLEVFVFCVSQYKK
jgi:hypothetical protein